MGCVWTGATWTCPPPPPRLGPSNPRSLRAPGPRYCRAPGALQIRDARRSTAQCPGGRGPGHGLRPPSPSPRAGAHSARSRGRRATVSPGPRATTAIPRHGPLDAGPKGGGPPRRVGGGGHFAGGVGLPRPRAPGRPSGTPPRARGELPQNGGGVGTRPRYMNWGGVSYEGGPGDGALLSGALALAIFRHKYWHSVFIEKGANDHCSDPN